MSVTGIIAEYNPFHNGHRLQLENVRAERRSATAIVVCMSGAFTQRGTAAILPKDVRARCAVENGADLVIELPTVFAVRSAQYFAEGGVRLLAGLGIVDTLAFGTKCTDTEFLPRIAEKLNDTSTQDSLHKYLRQGLSYAGALTRALELDNKEETLLREPNTILAIEYLRAIASYASALRPLPLQRKGADYHDETLAGSIASASAIRKELTERGFDDAVCKAVPGTVAEALRSMREIPDDERLFRPLLAKLYTMTPETLAACFGINEGLENRILKAAKTTGSLREFCNTLCSRRYPMSRIGRTLLTLLLSFSPDEIAHFDEAGPLYIRVLAFNDRGRELLKDIRQKSSLPIVTRVRPFLRHSAEETDTPAQRMLQYDTLASDIWGLTLKELPPAGEDFRRSPVQIPKKL